MMLQYYMTKMLNIVNILKKKQEITRTYNEKGQSIRANRKDISVNKEWINSVYNFDKNKIRFLPAVHNYIFKLIVGYFNLVSKEMKDTLAYKKTRKIHRYSSEKVWVSSPEIKHLSDKLHITIYVYNRVYNVHKQKLDSLEFNWAPSIESSFYKKEIFVSPKNKVDIRVVKETSSEHKNYLVEYPNNLFTSHKSLKLSPFTNPTGKTPMNLLNYSTVSKSYTKIAVKKPSKMVEPVVEKSIKIKHELNIDVTNKIMLLKRLYPTFFGFKGIINKLSYINIIKWLKLDKLAMVNQYKYNYSNFLLDKQQWISQINLLNIERHNYLINQFEKELAYIKLKQVMLFNQFKFNELYLTPMIDNLQKVYNKKIVFNIIALKYYYLNSSILSQIIAAKLKKERFRGKPLIVVNKATSYIRTPSLGSNKLPRVELMYMGIQNVIFDNFEIKNKKRDNLEEFLLSKNNKSNINTHKLAIKNLENKVIAGLFFKISGRLTKRFRADRATSRLRTKGTLKNVYSAHKGITSNLSRGYSNINVEKNMLHSKTRIGAYGLTGWMASY